MMRKSGLVLVLLAVAGCGAPPPAGSPDNAAEAAADAIERAAANIQAEVAAGGAGAAARGGTGWTYSEKIDPMTDKPTKSACVTSTNEVRLDAPYDNVTAELCLRDSPQHGRDAFVALNGEGQILCRSYERCKLQVRFGKAPARNFSGIGASDGSSNIVFFTDRASLEKGVRTADETIVQIEFYEAGQQAIRFPTKGLDWK